MKYMGMAGVASISIMAWLMGEAVKLSPLDNKWIPLLCGITGGVLGVLGMKLMPEFPAADLMSAAAVGISSGLAATGADQLGRQLEK